MEEAKMTYEDLLIKVKDQEFKIQEIEKDLAAQKNILNEVKNNIMASSFSIYSLSIKNDGSLFYNYIYGAVDRVYGLEFTNKGNVNSLVLEQ